MDRRQHQIAIGFPDRRGKERRRSPRVNVELWLTFQYLGKNVKAFCKDIGLGGVRIFSDIPVPVGTRLVLQISFNRNLCFMGFTGIVVFVLELADDSARKARDIGVHFTNLGQVEETVLGACIVELTKSSAQPNSSIGSTLSEKHIDIFVTDREINASQYIRRRVVITGIGIVSPIGIGMRAFSEGLREGRSGVKPVTRFDVTDLPTKLAAQVSDFKPLQYISPQKLKQMDRCTQFAVAAALMAVSDARLELEKFDRERTGALIGTAIGGLRWAFEQNLAREAGGFKSMDPRSMIATYPNAVSGQVSLELGLKGQTDTISSGCASAGTAFGSAAELIQHGDLDMLFVGGTEDPIEATVFSAMCAAGALSTMNEKPYRTPRPFDAERDGPILGEGAGILIFEELEHALDRGAPIYAEFKGWGSTSDAFSLSRTDPNGTQAARAIRMALDNASISVDEIDYINAYGIGTPSCDWAEARVIKEVFGDRAKKIPISAIQSMLGYPWAAHGAFQLIANCLAIAEGIIAPTINYSVPDPNCDLDIVANQSRHSSVNIAMSNLFGCGKNVVLLVQRFS